MNNLRISTIDLLVIITCRFSPLSCAISRFCGLKDLQIGGQSRTFADENAPG